MAITNFDGRYRFLSNFWPAIVKYEEVIYPSVEHAYQAAKTTNKSGRAYILCSATAAIAKKRGRLLDLRPDWDKVKISIMYELLKEKFKDISLKEQLLLTENEELIEVNWWGDTFWGQCPIGNGHNWLGKLLMDVRNELKGFEGGFI